MGTFAFSQIRLPDDTTVELYRIHPDRPPRYLTSVALPRFDITRICERYRDGRFVVYLKRHGRVILARTFQIKTKSIIKTRLYVVNWGRSGRSYRTLVQVRTSWG